MNNSITSMNKAEINQHNQEKVIDSILEGKERMARIPYVKRLLFRWWKWRNLSRNTLPPQLDLKNDHVDASRSRNDLINAGACDFEMFRLDRIINKLEPSLKEAVYAFYGHRGLRGLIHAADELGITKSSMSRRLSCADRAIAEALDELRNKEKSC
ncbi:hypothetical protein [Parasutterella sp.]|uniref:hypothetical protein n=1 Tax=Parasutterella sp. TaxID=2049037 RepID=UPI003521097D